MLNVDDVGLRHEWLEGYEFVDYRVIGIPVYRLVTDAIVLARTPLSSLQSFILRSIALKLGDTRDIANTLGLDFETTEKVVGVLKGDSLIRECFDPARSMDVLEMTVRGDEVLKEDGQVAPQERTEFVEFEGWLRKPIRIRQDSLFSARQIRDQGGLLMPSIPSKPPRLSEISMGDVETVLRGRDVLESGERLLEMKRIVRRLLKYRVGIGILHRRIEGNELRLTTVMVGGAPSEEHGWVFASGGYLKRKDLIHGVRADLIRRRMRECVGEEAWLCSLPAVEFATRRRGLFDAKARQENVRLALASEDGTGRRQALESELMLSSNSVRQALMALEDVPVRPVSPLEYSTLLVDALRFGERAVLIDTIGLDSSILRTDILDLIEAKVKEGVRIVIRCNQNYDRKKGRIAPAVERLLSLRSYDRFSLISRPRNAVFFLLRDESFALLSNRPFLMNTAERERFFCQMGYLIREPKLTSQTLKASGPLIDSLENSRQRMCKFGCSFDPA